MKVIWYNGDEDMGKTGIVNKILKDFFNVKLILPKIRKDVCIKFTFNDRIVGICSSGDDEDSVDRLKQLKECDIIICAVRGSNMVLDYLKENFRDALEPPINCIWRYGTTDEGKDKENNQRLEEFKEKYGYLFSV